MGPDIVFGNVGGHSGRAHGGHGACRGRGGRGSGRGLGGGRGRGRGRSRGRGGGHDVVETMNEDDIREDNVVANISAFLKSSFEVCKEIVSE